MGFKKAVKSQAKLRLALFGISGSGKTFTALSIASGMGKKIALIDSERGSASLYADRFEFDVVDLNEKSIDNYIQAIKEANECGYDVLVIDSMTHAWQELLTEIDKLTNTKYKGNQWRAWSEGTPKQKAFIDAILSYNGHVIATMRSKTEWTTDKDSNGKVSPKRVGQEAEQGKGIEYEFTLLGEISADHSLMFIKDRTGKFQDRIIQKPDNKLGKELIEWLNTGEPVKEQVEEHNNQHEENHKLNEEIKQKKIALDKEIHELLKGKQLLIDNLLETLREKKVKKYTELTIPEMEAILNDVKETLKLGGEK